ncbi:MAG: UGSC family (seleno)protein, partial [Pseudomonadota bacterium]|nr:UGSC family (seleno)protein [Pseudomonadota bacterium]
GNTGEKMMPYLADAVLKQNTWQLVFTIGTSPGTLRPLLVLSPILAQTLANDGWSKQDVKQYFYDHYRVPAAAFERYLGEWTDHPINNLRNEVGLNRAPKVFAENEDPDRMAPIVFSPNDFMVAISGDPLRTNAITFAHNGILGYTVAREIELPKDWDAKLRAVR